MPLPSPIADGVYELEYVEGHTSLTTHTYNRATGVLTALGTAGAATLEVALVGTARQFKIKGVIRMTIDDTGLLTVPLLSYATPHGVAARVEFRRLTGPFPFAVATLTETGLYVSQVFEEALLASDDQMKFFPLCAITPKGLVANAITEAAV